MWRARARFKFLRPSFSESFRKYLYCLELSNQDAAAIFCDELSGGNLCYEIRFPGSRNSPYEYICGDFSKEDTIESCKLKVIVLCKSIGWELTGMDLMPSKESIDDL